METVEKARYLYYKANYGSITLSLHLENSSKTNGWIRLDKCYQKQQTI